MSEDIGKFKTPTLREIARTAPYMHDGSIATLEDVVDFYTDGGRQNPFLDREVRPLRLTDDEKMALVVSSSGMVLTVPSTYSLRAPAPSSEAGVLAQAATAP